MFFSYLHSCLLRYILSQVFELYIYTLTPGWASLLLSCLLKGQGTADTVLPYTIKVIHILHWGKMESIILLFYSSKKISETLSSRTWTASCLASLDTFHHPSLPWICDILKKVFKKGWSKIVEYGSSQGAYSLKKIIQNMMRWFPNIILTVVSW